MFCVFVCLENAIAGDVYYKSPLRNLHNDKSFGFGCVLICVYRKRSNLVHKKSIYFYGFARRSMVNFIRDADCGEMLITSRERVSSTER